MKWRTITGLSVIIVAVGMLLHWRQARISEFDMKFRRDLAGTWSAELDNMRLTNVVMPDGSFTCQLKFRHPERTNTYQETGTWQIKGGHLIETVKSDTNPTAVSPRSHAGRILRTRAGEFVVQWQGSPDEWVWQKLDDSKQ